jgi:hypothetical protein
MHAGLVCHDRTERFAPPRSPPCEDGLRAVLGDLLQMPLHSTLCALPFRNHLFPLTIALLPSWPAAVASAPVRSQTRMPRELVHV